MKKYVYLVSVMMFELVINHINVQQEHLQKMCPFRYKRESRVLLQFYTYISLSEKRINNLV